MTVSASTVTPFTNPSALLPTEGEVKKSALDAQQPINTDVAVVTPAQTEEDRVLAATSMKA